MPQQCKTCIQDFREGNYQEDDGMGGKTLFEGHKGYITLSGGSNLVDSWEPRYSWKQYSHQRERLGQYNCIHFEVRGICFLHFALRFTGPVALEIMWASSPVCRRVGVCQWINRHLHRRQPVALRYSRGLRIDYSDPHVSNQTPTTDTQYGKNRNPTQPLSAGRNILGTHHHFFR